MIVTCRQNINGQTDRLINRGAVKVDEIPKTCHYANQSEPGEARVAGRSSIGGGNAIFTCSR